MRARKRLGIGMRIAFHACAIGLLSAPRAQADVMISTDPTRNMSCANGVCAPTASDAILNVADLETLLASGNVVVTTTGSGVQANNIDVTAKLVWPANALTLDAWQSVSISAPMRMDGTDGTSALSIVTNDGGSGGAFAISGTGRVRIEKLSSRLTINGASYTLVKNIASLAAAIAKSPSGSFALASSFDASRDGTWQSSPIPTTFTGTFDGLGNVISNLSVNGPCCANLGLFATVGLNGTLQNIGLENATIASDQGKHTGMNIGTLAGESAGTIAYSYVTGAVSSTLNRTAGLGGLVGENNGVIERCHAATRVTAQRGYGGGLAASNDGTIDSSYATGGVSGTAAGGLVGGNIRGPISNSYATGNVRAVSIRRVIPYGGGLVGTNEEGTISNSYATGTVRGATLATIGGLVGNNQNAISFSYSTGAVIGKPGSIIGGFIGEDDSQAGSLTDDYWDVDTSGITDLSQGAGNIANDPGIAGLTTEQFQSGLPTGFDPAVWDENAQILDGFPYLLDNPPAKKK